MTLMSSFFTPGRSAFTSNALLFSTCGGTMGRGDAGAG